MRFEGIIICLKYFSVSETFITSFRWPKNESLLRLIDCLEKGTTEGVLLSSALQLELRHMAKTNAS